MKKKQTLSENDFFNLPKSQQAKELKKMTKRANVRLSLLEEKDSINLAYRQAYQYNLSNDRINNRFYEGTNYKSSNEIKQAYEAVSNFLENKGSTLKGIEQGVKETLQPMFEKIYSKDGTYIDQNIISKMSYQEKLYASKYIAQASNKRLAELEKNDINQYAYELAKHYNEKLQKRDKNRYYRGLNFKNEEALNAHLEEMILFYNAKTSTVAGYQDSVVRRLDTFREKGVNIPNNKESEKDFFDFMSSEEYKNYIKNLDSEQVAKLYQEARNKGKTVEEINKKFQDYQDGRLKSIDQVQEKLGVAPWVKETKHKFKPRKK